VLFHADYGIHPFSFNDNSIELGRNINKQDVDSTLRQNIMLASQQPSLVTPKMLKKISCSRSFSAFVASQKMSVPPFCVCQFWESYSIRFLMGYAC
jgi:hypothetical protein